MTYFGFLLRFLVIPIFAFLVIAYRDHKRNRQLLGFQNGRAVWIVIGIHIVLAVVYTTPWDNYLVATGVWFYNPKLVTGLFIGYVPLEEYTFFVLETILSGLWWCFLVYRLSFPQEEFRSKRRSAYLSASLLASLWLASTYLFFFGEVRWTYLSIILFWALPAIIVQVLFGADILWHYRKLVAWSILVPGLYLWLIDIVALQETTWSISPSQTTGILFFGILPLEEVLFFFVTNMLLTFGITLLSARLSQARFAWIRKQVQTWREQRGLTPPSH